MLRRPCPTKDYPADAGAVPVHHRGRPRREPPRRHVLRRARPAGAQDGGGRDGRLTSPAWRCGQPPPDPASRPPGRSQPVRRRRMPLVARSVLWAQREGARRDASLLAVFIAGGGLRAAASRRTTRRAGSFDAVERARAARNCSAPPQQRPGHLVPAVYGTRMSLLVGLLGGRSPRSIALVDRPGRRVPARPGSTRCCRFVINLALVIPVLPLMVTFAAYSPVRGIAADRRSSSASPAGPCGARVKRAQIITLRTRDYVTAAQVRRRRDAPDHLPGDHAEHDLPGRRRVHRRGHRPRSAPRRAWRSWASATRRIVSWGTMLYQVERSGAACSPAPWVWLFAPGPVPGAPDHLADA